MKSKGKSRYNQRVGKFLFIAPAAIIIILVLYAYVELHAPGTLDVRALDENGNQLHVEAAVNGNTVTTPANVSLAQGTYIVNFTTITWYYPPASRDVVVTPGMTSYADALYTPVTVFVQVTGSGFNVTRISALHGVTPVTWINPSSSLVTFSGGPFQQVRLNPGQSYSYTFTSAETFTINVGSTNETMTVDVQ
jgi:hypothetical protein